MATTPVGNPYVESSDLVANYPGASEALAERIDVVGVNPFADSAARATAIPSPTEGMMSSLNDTDAVERYDGAMWKPVGGKVLQVVRATDTTNRATTSTSFTDASISVTITPTSATSTILIFWGLTLTTASNIVARIQITDSANTAVGGAESSSFRAQTGGILDVSTTIIGYASPATTSAVTYKGRFLTDGGTFTLLNTTQTGQLFAIEVAP